ncbi:hypothetical protein HZC09_02425 [Candidatus Micrarchaeota archaeon]|nr:hypothetical protein [Candidatus Micrarchaeota archaeon]
MSALKTRGMFGSFYLNLVIAALLFVGLFLGSANFLGADTVGGRLLCSVVECRDNFVPLSGANFAEDAYRSVLEPLSEKDGVFLPFPSSERLELAFADGTTIIPEKHYIDNVSLMLDWSLVESTPIPTPALEPTPIATVEPSVLPTLEATATLDATAPLTPTPEADTTSSDANATTPAPEANATASGSNATATPTAEPTVVSAIESNVTATQLPTAEATASPSPEANATITPSPSPASSPTPTPSPEQNASVTLSSSLLRFDSLTSEVVVSAWNGETFEQVCVLDVSGSTGDCVLTGFYQKYPLLLKEPKLQLSFSSSGAELLVDAAKFVITSLPVQEPQVNVTKTKEDFKFEAIIDSVERQENDLVVLFHHNSKQEQPIFVKGKVDYFLSRNSSVGGENVSLRIYNYSDEFFKLRIGSRSEVFAFGESEQVSFTPGVTDAQGNSREAAVTVRESETSSVELAGSVSSQVSLEQGEYDVTLDLQGAPVEKIVLERAAVFGDSNEIIRVDEVDTLAADEVKPLKVFAIAPGDVDFERGSFSSSAQGNTLIKCPSWVFEGQTCPGGWQYVRDLVPGFKYTSLFTATDPAYAEIEATAADHLDWGYGFVSSVFEDVKAKDDVWSERIPVGHAVRVEYEHALENGNVIDVFFRGEPTTRFDVYVAGSDLLVGSSKAASSTERGKWVFINVSGLSSPQNLFDFRVVGPDGGYVEFDYIHDAPGETLYVSSNMNLGGGDWAYANIVVTNGATLMFGSNQTGGTTVTVSGTITVNASSTLLLKGNYTSNTNGVGVNVSAANLTVAAGSYISASAVGYGGGVNANGSGPGRGTTGDCRGGGGGHGGAGGAAVGTGAFGGSVYGSSVAPLDLGSGGAGALSSCSVDVVGGAGGGAVFLNVSGTFTLNGVVTADGAASGSNSGGGSGGSIYVVTSTLAGSGNFTANGGGTGGWGGSGGGGRIAVYFASAGGFSGFEESSATGGVAGGNGGGAGVNGTVGFFDTSVAGNGLFVYQRFTFGSGVVSRSLGSVVVNNSGNFTMEGNTTLSVSGSVRVTGLSTLFFAGYYSSNSDGVGANLSAVNVTVDAGSFISANSLGYAGGAASSNGSGSGRGLLGDCRGGGGAYGGQGGNGGGDAGAVGGSAYGSSTAPLDLGSGGAGSLSSCNTGVGGAGGGSIFLNVSGTFTLNGQVVANGGAGSGGGSSGGGSGGSIYVVANVLSGSGNFTVNGGNGGDGFGGAGGGGRIAVYFASAGGFSGFEESSATGGVAGGNGGGAGVNGTIGFFDTSVAGNGLFVYQRFTFGSGVVSRSLGSVVVNNSGNFTMEGNTTLSVSGSVRVTGLSTLFFSGYYSSNSDGVGANLSAVNVTVDAGSFISANSLGYAGGPLGSNGSGSGAGLLGDCRGGGGGYGGAGGAGAGSGASGGSTYGSNAAPLDLGSGGAGAKSGCATGSGGAGGGAIFLNVSNTLTLNGVVTADGASATNAAGGGSGGSIYVVTNVLSGSGNFSADAGDASTNWGGGGGGGRAAVYYRTNSSTGTTTVAGGAGGGGGAAAGSSGTTYFFQTDGTAPTVVLNSPANNANSSSNNVTFNFTATDNVGFSSATLYTNQSGVWAANNTNSSAVTNNTPNVLSVAGFADNYLVWNVYVCDGSSNCDFASSNRTLVVDTTNPTV